MELNTDQLKEVTGKYNRHKTQCQFLYDILGCNYELYLELEDAIKYLNVCYSPGDSEECNYLLARYRVRKHVDKLYKQYSGRDWDYRKQPFDFWGNEVKTYGGWKH